MSAALRIAIYFALGNAIAHSFADLHSQRLGWTLVAVAVALLALDFMRDFE